MQRMLQNIQKKYSLIHISLNAIWGLIIVYNIQRKFECMPHMRFYTSYQPALNLLNVINCVILVI